MEPMLFSDSIHSLLLVSPQTYNYHQILFAACERASIDFVWLDERPFSSTFFKVISRKLNKAARKLSSGHYLARLQAIKASGFNPSHILVIKGESIDPCVVAFMRSIFPGAKFVLYFWDSASNLPGHSQLTRLFDVVASFDSYDCQLNGWQYYPLFCGNPADFHRPVISSVGMEYDWSFVGVVHSDRLVVLDKLVKSSFSLNGFFLYIYFPSLLHFLYYLIVSPLPFLRLRRYFRSSPLPPKRLRSIYGQSACILDIHHPDQSGLTMRSIESVLSGVKLATTNSCISRDVFYDASRIFVLDRRRPSISPDFLDLVPSPIPEPVGNLFRPTSWLLSLLSI